MRALIQVAAISALSNPLRMQVPEAWFIPALGLLTGVIYAGLAAFERWQSRHARKGTD